MQDVPKIVRARLGASSTATAGDHPDPDVLTAFAEQLLASSERGRVTDHLARCGDCREIVALALPEASTTPSAAADEPIRRGWLSWPVLRWGFASVGVVAIVSLAIVQYRKTEQRAMVAGSSSVAERVSEAKDEGPAAPAPATSTPAPAPPAADAVQAQENKDLAMTNRATGEKSSLTALPAFKKALPAVVASAPAPARELGAGQLAARAAGSVGGAVGGPITRGQFHGAVGGIVAGSAGRIAPQGNVSAPAAQESRTAPALNGSLDRKQSQQITVAHQNEVVEVQAQAGPVTDQVRAQPAQGAAVQNQVAQNQAIRNEVVSQNAVMQNQANQSQVAENQVAQNQLAQNQIAQNQAQDLPLNGRNVTEMETVSKTKPAAPSTAPATTNSIQDAGASSENISSQNMVVVESVAPRWTISATGSLQRSLDGGATWQAVNIYGPSVMSARALQVAAAKAATVKDKETKQIRRQLAYPVFRALSANGSEVWAGGSSGALFHSTDAGDHWVQVIPAASGAMLTGDILSVEFSGPRTGKVVTSTSEIWTTADGGQTWTKQ